jgi:tetratricopeptide (TPR) repeat protein
VNLGGVRAQLGAFEQAEAALREALATADRLHLPFIRASARLNLGVALAGRGAIHEALVEERQAAAEALAQGDRRVQAAAQLYLAQVLTDAGAFAEAEAAARAGLGRAGPIWPLSAYAHGALARALLGQGRADEALPAAAEAMRLLQELGRIELGEALIRLSYAESLHATGARDRACEAIRDARARLLARATKIAEPALRQTFLDRIREHARTMALAREWAGEDERPWASPTAVPTD